MKIWQFGMIGCGMIAEVHMDAIGATPNARVACVSSRNEERACEAAKRLDCDWTVNYKDMLSRDDIDIVCITTSSGSHFPIALDALQAGKHVVVEKPLAMTSGEADQLIRLAEQRNLVLSVISQSRFNEHHQLVKTVIDQGGIGKLLFVEISRPYYRTQAYYDSADWRGTIREDGGAVMNQGIHSIDLLLWIAGPVQHVHSRTATQTHRMEAEDIGVALLAFSNGAIGTFMCSTSMTPGFEPTFHLYGERGAIRIEGRRITHWSVPGVDLPESLRPDRHVERSGTGASDPRNISYYYHQLQLADILEAIETGRKPAVTGEDGKNAVHLVEMIINSANNQGV